MKKLYLIIALLSLAAAGCSGYLYTDLPPVEFSQTDYGFTTKTASTNPAISYIDEGKGETTVILVHGLASNAGFWRYNIPELAKHYRVIAVDLPGYGKSQKGYYSYSLSFYADEIKKLADALHLKKFVYVGHSMGGQIGIIFSLKYPQYLQKLVLASPAGFEEFEQGEGDWLRSVMTVNGVKLTTEEGIRRNLAMNFYNWNNKWEWMVEERVRQKKAADFDAFCYTVVRCVNAMLDEPTWNRLSGINTPTLIIHGKNDGLIPNPYLNPGFSSEVFKYGESQIKGSIRHEIDNCGHMLQIEHPEEFNSTLIDFIK